MKKMVSLFLTLALVSGLAVSALAYTPPKHKVPADGQPLVVGAETYDLGGQDKAYNFNATESWVPGPSDLRPDDTGKGIGPILEESGGKYNTGYVSTGFWINYTVEFPVSGIYSLSGEMGGEPSATVNFDIGSNKNAVRQTGITTGSWTTFKNFDFGNFEVAAGKHVVRINYEAEAVNVRSFTIKLVEAKEVAGSPKTGDNNFIVMAVMVFGLSVIGMVALRRKVKA